MYQPKFPPMSADLKGLVDYVYSELQAVADSQYEPRDFVFLNTLNVAPEKPREGMVAKADGVHWNPGAGAGVYVYTAGAWSKF